MGFAAPCQLHAQSLPIYGGLTYDAATSSGYLNATFHRSELGKSVNDNGVAAGIVTKYSQGDKGHRAVRWNVAGSALELGNLGLNAGTPVGYTRNVAYAINGTGQVVGQATKYVGNFNRGDRPVRWDASGTAVELAVLGLNSSASTTGYAFAINDSGLAVGHVEKWVANANKGPRAVRWDAAGNALELALATDPTGFGASHAEGINASGQIVGSSVKYVEGVSKGFRPIRWSAAGAAQELDVLGTNPAGSIDSVVTAYAVNDAGRAVGVVPEFIGGVDRGLRAVRWDAAIGAVEKLGTINPFNPDSDYSHAYQINNAGDVVGYAAKASVYGRGVRWDAETGAALELELLLPDFVHTSAWSLNSAGQVAGAAYKIVSGNQVVRAVYWERDGAITDLNTLLAPADAEQWTLTYASSISDNGWIAGNGKYDPDGAAGPQASYDRHFLMRATSNWTGGGGSWDAAGNWSNGFTPGPASSHVFNRGAASAYTVTLSPASRARQVMVGNDRVTLDLAGSTLTLAGRLAVAPVRGETGVLTIVNGTVRADTVNVGGAFGAGPGLAGGAGVLNINAGCRLEVVGSLTVFDANGTALNLAGGTLSAGNLDVGANPSRFNWTAGTLEITGANVTVTPGAGLGVVELTPAKTLRIKDASISILVDPSGALTFSGGTLDLTDKKLIATSADAGTATNGVYSGIQGLVQSGRNGGTWDGPGIVTSMPAAITELTSLGVATAEQAGYADLIFGEVFVAATDVLVMYTYGGDATLDGKIDIDDYGQIDSNVSKSGVVFGWFAGDFNYDGKINIDDYGIIDGNINRQSETFPTGALGLHGVTAVPEPSTVALVVAAASTSLMRRRRAT